MKLKINPDPQFTGEVGISVPGIKHPVIVKVTFKYMDRDQYLAFMEKNKEVPIVDILPELVVGWNGFDEEYSVEALKEVFKNYPCTAPDMLSVYSNELFLSKVKN